MANFELTRAFTSPKFKPDEVSSAVKLLSSRNQTNEVLKPILNQIHAQTGCLSLCRRLDIDLSKIGQWEDGYMGGVMVEWGVTDDMQSDGRFILRTRTVQVKNSPPTEVGLLTALATTGEFPDEVVTLAHELVHSRQISGEQLISRYAVPPVEIVEAQAYRAEGELAIASQCRVVRHILKARGTDNNLLYPNTDKKDLYRAVSLVDQLLALGVGHLRVAEEIQMFCLERSPQELFCHLGDWRDWLTQKRGWKFSDLQAQHHYRRMRRRFDQLKVKVLAQNELAVLAG